MIKNLFSFLVLSLLFSSCITQVPISVREAKIISNGVDYSEFAQAGFFITEANSVSFEYKTVGSVSAYVQSGGKNGAYTYSNSSKLLANQVIMTPRDAVKKLYDEAKALGANGIINLKIIRTFDPFTYLNDGYEATGMAIVKY